MEADLSVVYPPTSLKGANKPVGFPRVYGYCYLNLLEKSYHFNAICLLGVCPSGSDIISAFNQLASQNPAKSIFSCGKVSAIRGFEDQEVHIVSVSDDSPNSFSSEEYLYKIMARNLSKKYGADSSEIWLLDDSPTESDGDMFYMAQEGFQGIREDFEHEDKEDEPWYFSEEHGDFINITDVDGYCYLHLFKNSCKKTVAEVVGMYPRWNRLDTFCKRLMGENLIYVVEPRKSMSFGFLIRDNGSVHISKRGEGEGMTPFQTLNHMYVLFTRDGINPVIGSIGQNRAENNRLTETENQANGIPQIQENNSMREIVGPFDGELQEYTEIRGYLQLFGQAHREIIRDQLGDHPLLTDLIILFNVLTRLHEANPFVICPMNNNHLFKFQRVGELVGEISIAEHNGWSSQGLVKFFEERVTDTTDWYSIRMTA